MIDKSNFFPSLINSKNVLQKEKNAHTNESCKQIQVILSDSVNVSFIYIAVRATAIPLF